MIVGVKNNMVDNIFKFKLGDKVKCRYSGFEGTIVCRSQFINGCMQYSVLANNKDKTKLPEEIGIDEQSLLLVEKIKRIIKKEKNGGPMRKITQRNF